EMARKGADEAGLGNVSFVQADIRGPLALGDDFDALIGRLVLMHLSDPAVVLRSLLGQLKPDGIAAFEEPNMASRWSMEPSAPLRKEAYEYLLEGLRAAGSEKSMGLKLFGTFLDAGLPEPALRANQPIATWKDTEAVSMLVLSLRALVPVLKQSGNTRVE